MKMKSFILPALALALFAACSGEEALTSENKVQQTTQNDAVTFDAYLNRTVTRAGWPGAMTTSTGEHNLRTEGFGVFAYYADGDLYSENVRKEKKRFSWLTQECFVSLQARNYKR